MDDHPIFADPEPPADLVDRFAHKGWDLALLRRAGRLRLPRFEIDEWLDSGWITPELIEPFLAERELLADGTMRVRGLTWEDDERLADLYANSAEKIGPWLVTVERSPNPQAQFRLQENPTMQVLDNKGVLLASFASSGRNTLIGSEELSVNIMSAWRVRDGFRKLGYSNLIRQHPGHAFAWFGLVSYWYVRLDNEAALGFIDGIRNRFEDRPDDWKVEFQGLTATVHHLPARPERGRPDPRVRPTTRADLDRCIELINRTHDGLDLFRPYSTDYLRQRLDQRTWGPKPPFIAHIYGWDDHLVLCDETTGEVVACAGLWDRGRDVRERWRNTSTGEERTVDDACVLDFGCAEGRERGAGLAHRPSAGPHGRAWSGLAHRPTRVPSRSRAGVGVG